MLTATGRGRGGVSPALWMMPASAIVLALALGASLSRVHVAPGSLLDQVAFKGSEADARQLLAVVTGTMITVTSLVFALTVATLQIASTQYSPRLLRSFLRDPGTQLVMSVLVGTDAYSLAGLQGVGSSGPGSVPRLAVSGALGLALLSVAMLVFYVGHMTNEIRFDTIMRTVSSRCRAVLARDHPLVVEDGSDPDAFDATPIPEHAMTLAAPDDGYFQDVDAGRLAPLLARGGARVRLLPLVGYHVVEGEPLAAVWSEDGGAPSDATLKAVADAIVLLPERVSELYLGFDIRQLIDMANRAMGTTQNDPYTAVQAVHHLTAVLSDAARRSFMTRQFRDDGGQVRVSIPIMDFPTHLRVVCSHVRRGGSERHPRVTLELLRLLGAVAVASVSETRRSAVDRELDAVVSDAHRTIPHGEDLEEMERTAADARARLELARVAGKASVERPS